MTDDPTLPLAISTSDPAAGAPRHRFRTGYLLVLLVPLLMFTGAVVGLYFQPPALQ